MTPGKRKEIIIFTIVGLALIGSVVIAISGKGGPAPIGVINSQATSTPIVPLSTPSK